VKAEDHRNTGAIEEERGPDWTACARDGVVYIRMGGTLSRGVVDVTRRLHQVALRQRPEGVGIICDLVGKPSLPPADVRDYATREAANHPGGICGHVTILRGEGFFGAMIRSVITGMFLIAKSPYKRTIVSTPDEAFEFVRKQMGPPLVNKIAIARTFHELPHPH
jgi:hypothetical protein